MEIPCTGQGLKSFKVTEEMVEGYRESFPALDVVQHLREARQWCQDNPKNRKTWGGVRRFLGSWLARNQDRSRKGNLRPSERATAELAAWAAEGKEAESA